MKLLDSLRKWYITNLLGIQHSFNKVLSSIRGLMIQGDFFSIWEIKSLTQTFMQESIPDKWQRLGGRALLARILVDEGQHLRYNSPG